MKGSKIFILILLLISISSLVSAAGNLIFTNGPTCDMENINLEAEYTGNSSIYAPNINVYVTAENVDYRLAGTWSETYLQYGDKVQFHSLNFGGLNPELNKQYQLYLDTNTEEGWSNPISLYCTNDPSAGYSNGAMTCYYYYNGNCDNKNVYAGSTSCPSSGYMSMPLFPSKSACLSQQVTCWRISGNNCNIYLMNIRDGCGDDYNSQSDCQDNLPNNQNLILTAQSKSNGLLISIIITIAIIAGFIILGKILNKRKHE
jgi:hypothetical protein